MRLWLVVDDPLNVPVPPEPTKAPPPSLKELETWGAAWLLLLLAAILGYVALWLFTGKR